MAGKDKGKTGQVVKSFPEASTVLVEGLNLFKKHTRARQQDKKGEVILIPKPVSVSKVRLVCSSCHKITRAGYVVASGNKTRICKKCKQAL